MNCYGIAPMPPKHSYLIDDTIQVRFGIKDADFPMITIGGWVGKITEVDLHHNTLESRDIKPDASSF